MNPVIRTPPNSETPLTQTFTSDSLMLCNYACNNNTISQKYYYVSSSLS